MTLIENFARTYIVNLPERTDRRREMDAELAQFGLRADGERIRYFRAIRPTDAGDFPNLGARGCFLSHLAILEEALRDGLESVLILEDDLRLDPRIAQLPETMHQRLRRDDWDFAYLGHVAPCADTDTAHWRETRQPLATTHCYALRGPAIAALRDHLAACLTRPSGHPLGSPMHVDGAYSLFRQFHPEIVTLLAVPSLGGQLSSLCDIFPHQWYDRFAPTRALASLARHLKNQRTRLPA